MADNVLGTKLEYCCQDPVTGFFRDGYCNTCAEDIGMHTVCAVMTDEFLEFSFVHGNDLSTPMPQYEFFGLKPGDRWCLCLPRWLEALKEGKAPRIYLKSTHVSVLEHVELDVLKQYSVDGGDEERVNL